MDIVHYFLQHFPKLKKEMRMAHIREKPHEYMKNALKKSSFFAAAAATLAFLALVKAGFFAAFFAMLCSFLFFFSLFFTYHVYLPKKLIQKRKREIDREVLFAGRYLLVKLHSGMPLLNSLIDASRSYGVANKYFKEIVDDINMGTPLENAIDNAVKYTPSEKFKKILFQIYNAITVGVDVSDALKATLDELTAEQHVEIQKYGKKLNSLSLFYMLIAVVMPSLGVTMLIVIGTLMGFFREENAVLILGSVVGLLFILQFVFISIFKTSRLSVNL